MYLKVIMGRGLPNLSKKAARLTKFELIHQTRLKLISTLYLKNVLFGNEPTNKNCISDYNSD